ncbi:hypothetical protein [Arthrobacter sp. ISL-5]|uniref:hypothetical protein n=1 Tax=Arthrobacter sp. ISL-5 TaxID=2819111 RepID=UPI001BE86CBC|nr:hypothetical protein [Arthrobacter sp. ISL-5]MBT2555626.1 hypothetical protein [Arthrobacter sp. ISL-5]
MTDNTSLSRRSSQRRARSAGRAIQLALLILVAALALSACTDPTPGTEPTNTTQTVDPTKTKTASRTAIPDELVGEWNGGPDPGEFWLTLTNDGRYQLSNARYGYSDSGVVALDQSSMKFTSEITGREQTRRWTLQTSPDLYGSKFSILSLDGYSYVKEA